MKIYIVIFDKGDYEFFDEEFIIAFFDEQKAEEYADMLDRKLYDDYKKRMISQGFLFLENNQMTRYHYVKSVTVGDYKA